MALIFCDGFDHYGALANMLDGVYDTVDSGAGQYSLSTSDPMTGTHSLRRGTATAGECLRSLGSEKSVVGLGQWLKVDQLPSVDDTYHLAQFRDSGGDNQISIVLQSDGFLSVKRGNADDETPSDSDYSGILETSQAVVYAGEKFHIEALIRFDDTDGAIEIRVNEVTVIHSHDIDTLWTTGGGCSQINLAGCVTGVAHGVTADIDDVFCYDDGDNTCNDFLGYRWVNRRLLKQDTALSELTVTGANTGFAAINDATPNDDTSYIAGTSGLPKASEFELRLSGQGVGAISAIQLYAYMRTTSAGTAYASLVSESSLTTGATHTLTTSYAYYTDVLPRDPDTGAPWTWQKLDDAGLRITAASGTVRITQAAILSLETQTPCLTQRCQLWKITRRDAFVFAFTTHDEDVTWRGVTYKACDSLRASAIDAGIISTNGVGDGQVNGLLADASITEFDLVNGLFDGATVEVWQYPWGGDASDVPRKLTGGILGKTSQGGTTYTAEMLTPGAKLTQKPLLDSFTPACRFRDISDPRCPVDPEAYRVSGTVTSVESRDAFNRATYRRFTDTSLIAGSSAQAAGYWDLGLLTWLTGDNAGIQSEIKSFDDTGTVTLWAAMPYEISAGDTYDMIPGCDKLGATHTDKFGLPKSSFGGFENLPGLDRLIKTPNAKS